MNEDKSTQEPVKSEEYQNFERLVKAAFTTPKAKVDAAIHEDNKRRRKRVVVVVKRNETN